MSPARRVSEPARLLPGTVALADFMEETEPGMPIAGRYALVEQARLLLDGAYVHLPLKRAMHAIDPLQRLRLLKRRVGGLSDLQFHVELAGLFRSLRDLHTVYQLPDPYRGRVATLGFLVERYHDVDGAPHHIVTKIDRSLEQGGFRVGAELTAWNGIPIERAVEANAERQSGSNAEARLARGLEALTLRSLRTGPPPDEPWVLLEYRAESGRRNEIRVPWRVKAADTRNGRAQDPVSTISAVLGIDAGRESARQIKRTLFAPDTGRRRAEPRALRSVLQSGTRRLAGRPHAYLRFYSFNVAGARRFAEEVARTLARLPQGGLIVDIRGNPGGNVPAAEAVLQLLSPDRIEPASFSLATTPLALELCQTHPGFAVWRPSIQNAVETGELYSQGFPLSDPEELVEGLPRYRGPVVLVTDAVSYSAADIFASGFQDNELGPVLGTAGLTGAGGANVWTHDLLRRWLPDTLGEVPAGAGFRVALRRATRVRRNVGVPLEDLGVQADQVHRPTRRDVTGRNQDLLGAAGRLLAQ